MIVNTGKLKLLDAQASYLITLVWGLFTSNTVISPTTLFSDLTEAAFAGYLRVAITSAPASTIVGGKASTSPAPAPVFVNTGGAGAVIFGWFLFDSGAGKLIAATNIGSTTIPPGGSYAPTPTITDDQGP